MDRARIVDVNDPARRRAPPVLEDDHFHDECGVFGVHGAVEAANLTYLGLHSLQHRGQEAAGIASTDGERLFVHRDVGLVQDVFTESVIGRLPGVTAIGHVRYSTAGGSYLKNVQPIAVDYAHGSICVAHNGNLTNADVLREELETAGSIFQTTSDTEVLVHLIARAQQPTTVERISHALKQVEGAYSMLFLTPEELVAVRDPYGLRPLCMGRLDDAIVFASEPPAFDLIAAEYVRDLEPGEMVVVDKRGLVRSSFPFEPKPHRFCVFEYVYFARPDARLEGISVYEARKRMGELLADEAPADVDLVIPVPDSGVAAALGYADRIGKRFELGLIRSHYVGRTFIEPSQSIRHFGVRLKLSPVKSLLHGKRVVVVDDSIVRGTTSRKIVKMLRSAGAKEVHLRISSPPTRWPCFYGIDTPSRSELIASSHSTEEVARYVTADSLGYLSLEGLHKAVSSLRQAPPNGVNVYARDASTSNGAPAPVVDDPQHGFCDACFSGNYPLPIAETRLSTKRQLPLVGV